MANVAILIGNTRYQTLAALDCCDDDVRAVKELLDATEKFETIEVILDADSSHLKDRVRAAVDAHESIGEIFFYFTGHGLQHDAEFFFCATTLTPSGRMKPAYRTQSCILYCGARMPSLS